MNTTVVPTAKSLNSKNAKNIIPEELEALRLKEEEKKIDFENVVGQDDITRFDDVKK